MKYIDEYRNRDEIFKYTDEISKIITQEWTLMEVCGGQTHSIVKYGLDQVLPSQVNLLHGPGCPVCVTPLEIIDQAITIAKKENVIFCSFGDMLRVPGSYTDLFSVKAAGNDVRIVYSPLDALKIAKKNPAKKIVFFAVGFETTAPANAMAVYQAALNKTDNFSILVSHVLVPPALETILGSKKNMVQAFLAAGHVCTIMGYQEYIPLAKKYKVPIIVTGFEPFDIVQGVYLCIKQLEEGKFEVENQYIRSVTKDGNVTAMDIVNKVFEITTRKWRGIGAITSSGLKLRNQFQEFDASLVFDTGSIIVKEPEDCISGLILQGIKKPPQCNAFGKTCNPDKPLGATMVSSEGACAAYFNYRKPEEP